MNLPQEELTQELVGEFVLTAHRNSAKVKVLHQQYPALLNARWEKYNETALEAAAHMGERETVEYLLTAGAPLDIYAVAMLGQTDQVAAFLEADPELARAKGIHGISVLYHAALSGNTAVAELLLAHGGGESIDNNALHAATRFGHTEMVGWLLTHGVIDVNPLNFNGKTPLQVAVESGHDDIAELLQQHGGTKAE